jgi:hypothetical protein
MGRRAGPKVKKRKKVLVTPAQRMNGKELTEPYRILEDLVKKYRGDLLEAQIIILWRSGWRSDPDGWVQMVNVKKAGDVDKALSVKADFAVMLNKERFPRLPERMKTIYLHHALCHMRPMIDADGEQKQDDQGRQLWRVKKRHDVEQFSEIIEIYGAESLNLDEDALAAINDLSRPLIAEAEKSEKPVRGSSSNGKGATYTNGAPVPPGAAAGATGSTAWRNWPVGVLGQYGMPPGKLKLLESAFDDRLGKLIDRMNRQGSEDHWWKDIRGFGESGYNALVDALMALRNAQPEFQADLK